MLKVKKINYDEHFENGCETCDYGSSYVNEIEITLEDEAYFNIKFDEMYDYVLTESDYMQLIANNNTIDEFILSAIKLIETECFKKDISSKISLRALGISINGKDIDIVNSNKKGKLVYFKN